MTISEQNLSKVKARVMTVKATQKTMFTMSREEKVPRYFGNLFQENH